MASTISLFFFLLLGATLTLSSPPVPPIAAATDDDSTTEFIRASCRATEYPNLCFRSLSRYANAVRNSPVELAHVAANVTHARVRSLSKRVAKMCGGSADPNNSSIAGLSWQEAGALRDCDSTLGDAADLTGRSAEELAGLGGAVGPEVAWRVANVQTWMSAALTNEDTCDDGFGRVGGPSAVKADVCRRVRVAERFTSNALALVNSLVAGR
ncbi:21 kDa protein [Iris pallida]|uniref:21 kDa protein n=1 Tax=Iris pallida TaxID=29817 RepID=A0AAX6FL00_IRIPA|nr:21 kDa protein [Iris pallida]